MSKERYGSSIVGLLAELAPLDLKVKQQVWHAVAVFSQDISRARRLYEEVTDER